MNKPVKNYYASSRPPQCLSLKLFYINYEFPVLKFDKNR